jgi:hypothetical protein
LCGWVRLGSGGEVAVDRSNAASDRGGDAVERDVEVACGFGRFPHGCFGFRGVRCGGFEGGEGLVVSGGDGLPGWSGHGFTLAVFPIVLTG